MRDDIFYYIYYFLLMSKSQPVIDILSGADSSIPTNAYETYTTGSR